MSTWIVEPALTPDGRGTGCYDVYENTEQGRFIATVDNKTDAELIAAAPELLVCLQCMVASVEARDSDSLANATLEAMQVISRVTGGAV